MRFGGFEGKAQCWETSNRSRVRFLLLSLDFQALGILSAADPDSFLETNTGLVAEKLPCLLASAISDRAGIFDTRAAYRRWVSREPSHPLRYVSNICGEGFWDLDLKAWIVPEFSPYS